MKKISVIPCMLCALFACAPKETPNDVTTSESAEEAAVSEYAVAEYEADTAYARELLNSMNEIERYAIKVDNNILVALLEFKGDSTAASRVLETIKPDERRSYRIKTIDAKNGYLVYEPVGVDVTHTVVYWNKKDGSKLIATGTLSCATLCDYGLAFSIFQNGKFKNVDLAEVIPEHESLLEMLIPDFDPNGDPVESRYELPQEGKNIQYCADKKCLELVWNDGTFSVKK